MAAIEKERREQELPKQEATEAGDSEEEEASPRLKINGEDEVVTMSSESGELLYEEIVDDMQHYKEFLPKSENEEIEIPENAAKNESSAYLSEAEDSQINNSSSHELEIQKEVQDILNDMATSISDRMKDAEFDKKTTENEAAENVKTNEPNFGNEDKILNIGILQTLTESSENAQVTTLEYTSNVTEQIELDQVSTISPAVSPGNIPPDLTVQDKSIENSMACESADFEQSSSEENLRKSVSEQQDTSILENSEKVACDRLTLQDMPNHLLETSVEQGTVCEINSTIMEKSTEDLKTEKPVIIRTVPKARKSCQPSKLSTSIIKTVNLHPIANMTVNLPDIESALELASRTVDNTKFCNKKVKNLDWKKDTINTSCEKKEETPHKMDQSAVELSVVSGDLNEKCMDDSLIDMDIGNVSTEPFLSTDTTVHTKVRSKKRRKKMGTYHLPNEKKKVYKRKKEKDDHSYEFKIKSSRTENEDTNNLELVDSADDTVSDISTYSTPDLLSRKLVTEKVDPHSKDLINNLLKSEKKYVMEALTQNSNLAFSSGEKSTSLLVTKKSPRSESFQPQSKSIAYFWKTDPTLHEENAQNVSNDIKDEDSAENTDAELRIKNCFKKRKLPEMDFATLQTSDELNNTVNENDSFFMNSEGKKPKLEGENLPQVITVVKASASNISTPVTYRSILPKNLSSILNPVMIATNSTSRTSTTQGVKQIPVNIQIASNSNPPTIRLSLIQGGDKIIPKGGLPVGQAIRVSSTMTSVMPIIGSSSAVTINKPVILAANNLSNPVTTVSSPASQAPVLNKLLTSGLHAYRENCDIHKDKPMPIVSSVPNGLSYPVTPPKTPEDSHSHTSTPVPAEGAPPDRDVIPLCCCKINGASFNKLGTSVTYCQALDSVDGKVMGCCNKVSNAQLVRPAVKIPFMAICEVHRKRLRLHQCCPGCGHFCTQGKFYQCRKEGGSSIHHFHKQCQFQKDMKFYCPHCGEESSQFEVTLTLNEPKDMSTVDSKRITKEQSKAKMGIQRTGISEIKNEEDIVTYTLSTSNKILSSAGVLLGPDRYSLEKVLGSLQDDRPKKFKSLPKNFYAPAFEGDLEKIIYMLDDGQDPNEKVEEYDEQTALHAAAINGSLAVVHILVQAGANIHALDRVLKTPLMYASENDHLSVVKYLLKSGANVKARAEDGMTALHLASKSGCIRILQYLLESEQIDVDVKDEGGWTSIIWACENKLVIAVRFLLKYGADPNLKDNEENTCLHWAAYSGSVDIAEILLNAGCDMDVPNEHGDRPLHIAARQEHYECIVLFLARGADVESKNNENETAVGCCLDQNSPVCLALKVNKQLKGLAAKRLGRPQKLIHRDITLGRENIPIACVNGVDDELVPEDYQYVTENVETTPLHINRVITSLQSCRCKDDCSSQLCVCSRISVKCWYTRDGKLIEDFNMLDPPLLFECNRACRCWTTCNNRVVQNSISARLQMVRTDGRGWGVKSLLDIPKGTFVCEYIGELISDHEADVREDDSYLFDLDNRDGETYCIDAGKYGNISRFINHLCEPNLIPVKVFMEHQDLRFPRICFFASKDIKAHEELGFDYGEKFWMIKWKQFTCACGSEKCKYSKDTIQKTLEEYRQRHGLDESSTME